MWYFLILSQMECNVIILGYYFGVRSKFDATYKYKSLKSSVSEPILMKLSSSQLQQNLI